MNRRSLILLLVVLAGVVSLVAWLAFGLKSAPMIDPTASEHGGASPGPSRTGTSLDALEAPTLDAAPAAAERTRAEPGGRALEALVDDSELAHATWVEGRLELAEGTPLDEEAWVVAKGRDFAHRPLHRTRVGPDGRFRVAFEPGTQLGWLQLAARYNFLDEQGGIRPSKPPQDIVLRGRLGGCVRGRILLPSDTQDFAADVRRGRVSGGNERFDFFGFQRKDGTIFDDLRYEVGGLEPGAERSVILKARGFLDVSISDVEIVAGAPTLRDLTLVLGSRLSGRVLAADGTRQADVKLRPKYGGAREPRFFDDDSVRTDAEGRFELVGLAGGDLSIVAQKSGFEPLIHALGETPAGTRRADLELVLGTGLSISGRVKFGDGRPAARALLTVEDSRDRSPSPDDIEELWRSQIEGREPIEADLAGEFKISGLRPGSYTLTAKAWVDSEGDAAPTPEEESGKVRKVRRGTPWSGRVENVAAGSSEIVLALTKGDTISGRVLDSDGKPVERFTVNAHPDRRSAGYTSEIGSIERFFRAKDGRFALEGLRACGWNVDVSAKGLLDSAKLAITVPGANQNLNFKLLRLARFTGVVLAPDRKPVEGAKVVCVGDTPSWRWDSKRAVAKTNAKGEFTLVNAPLGAIRMQAEAPGYAPSALLRFEIGPSTVRAGLELVLSKGGSIRGTITKEDGSNDAGRPVNLSASDGDFDKNATSDGSGAFAFERLPPGRYTLVTSESREELKKRYRSGVAAADMEDPQAMRATVDVRDGETVTVALENKRPPAIRMHGLVIAPKLVGLSIAVAPFAEDGTDSVRHAPVAEDGKYEVQLNPGGSRRVTVLDAGSNTLGTFQVEVPAGSEFERDFTLPGGRISGRVVDEDKVGIGRLRVRVFPANRRDMQDEVGAHQAYSDPDGSFAFEHVELGTYTVEADGSGMTDALLSGARVEGVVVKDAEGIKGLELVLREGGDVVGFVRNAAGDLMPGIAVFAFDANGYSFGSGESFESDSSARFSIEHVPAGRIFLYARTPSSAGKASVVVPADGAAEVDIVLRPRADLTVLVQDASGATVFGALEVVDQDGCHFEGIRPLPGITDAPAGARVFTSLPAGPYAVRAHGASGLIGEKHVRASEGARTDVVLRKDR